MQLDRDGAEHFPDAFGPAEVADLGAVFSSYRESARLGPTPGLAELVRVATHIARCYLADAEPVFARWFDKSPECNWSLAWHQDRTIALQDRRKCPGFTAWTVKSGLVHAVPPYDILARMLTVRLHLDDLDEANAPLLIALGSHRFGPVAGPEIPAIVERCDTHACLARAGDVWLYAAPILHASDRARRPGRRRVLQLSYAAPTLPGGLKWLGI